MEFKLGYKIIPICILIMFALILLIKPSMVLEAESKYQFYANSPYGEIKVDNDTLYIDGREQCCWCYPSNTSERMMVHYALDYIDPCYEYSEGVKTLNIGLGCGLTVEEIVKYSYNNNVDVVEINYQVVLANRKMSKVLDNPRVHLIVDDGLNYLRESSKRYQSIMIDVENPTVAHSSNLYTVEAFELVHEDLYGDGTFALWCFSGNDRYLGILYYSLKEVFPFVYHYDDVFVASKMDFGIEEYNPKTMWEINTIDRNVLTDAFLEG